MSEAEVVLDIKKYLSGREMEHPPTVLWWERLQSGSIHNGNQHIYLSRKGTADFLCLFVGKKKQVVALFIEAKSPDVEAKPRKGAQEDFMKKYNQRHIDMHYMIAQSREDVYKAIKELQYDMLQEIEL